MERETRTKALSILLSLALMLTLVPPLGGTALAASKAAVEALKPGIHYGKVDSAKVLEYAGKQWFVIASGSTGIPIADDAVTRQEGETTIILLAKENWSTSAFGNSVNYSGSTLQTKIDEYVTSEKIGTYYQEDDAWKNSLVAKRTLAGNGSPNSTAEAVDNIAGTAVENATLWPLSGKEAGMLETYCNVLNGVYAWWLRTPGYNGNNGTLATSATLGWTGLSNERGVRPALCLNLTSDIIATETSQGSGVYKLTRHTHSFTYTADGDTITAICGNHSDCPLEDSDNTATLTITAPTTGGGAAVLKQNPTDSLTNLPEVQYRTKSGSEFGEPSTTAPSDKGFYKAGITLTGTDSQATASTIYGVNVISVAAGITNGAVNDPPVVAAVDAGVTISTTPDRGYKLKDLTVTKSDNTDVSVTLDGNTGSFTMPDQEVTVNAVFEKIDYAIKINPNDYGTVTASKNSAPVSEENPANYNDTIQLSNTPVDNFTLVSYTVTKTGDSATTVTVDENGAFTMPDYPVTVSASFEGLPFDITVSESIAHGTVTVSGGGVTTEGGIKAKAGTEVTLTPNPDPGYSFGAYTLKDADQNDVTVSNGKFTMPVSAVTVGATFVGLPVTATLTVEGATGPACTASLLSADYSPVDSLTKKADETFILRVDSDDDYAYTVRFNDAVVTAGMREFNNDEYGDYVDSLTGDNLAISSKSDLYVATMPGVAGGQLHIKVTFGKVKPFTILYKPQTGQENVWCKFINSENQAYVARLKQEATLGEDSVWSVRVMSPFVPAGLAFGASLETVRDIVVDNLTPCAAQTNTEWHSISEDNYMVIGGNAKTAVVAFSTEVKADKSLDARYAEIISKIGSNASYQLAVCLINDDGSVSSPGTVTAPAAPAAREGFRFKGWRGFVYDDSAKASEKLYQPNKTVYIRENTVLSAVWDPITPKVTLNPNNGTGVRTDTATYGEPFTQPEDPAKAGFAFKDWAVSRNVTEADTFFPKGSPFDFAKGVTNDLGLNAEWEHVHSYTCYTISSFGDALRDYMEYDKYFHVKICGCGDIALEAHNGSGTCACGYTLLSTDDTATASVSYQKWEDASCVQTVNGGSNTQRKDTELTVYAPDIFGELYNFSAWEYSTDNGTTWRKLSADPLVSFPLTGNTELRAIYRNPTQHPELRLSTRSYLNARMDGFDEDLASILFQMDYKLPDGYTFVDGGVRLGDNAGISYYEMKEVKQTTEQQAITTGISFGLNLIPGIGGGVSGFLADQAKSAIEGPDYYYEKREDNVLNTMSAKTLSEYMYQFKPVNVEKYPPIYWESTVLTKSESGSLNVLTPVAFAQRNAGKHYIYGMAYLQYRQGNGPIQTIRTDAIAITLNDVLAGTNQTVTAPTDN